MAAYVLRRLLLMIPTLLGIMLLNFIIVQAAPGGPIDQVLARFQGLSSEASTRMAGGGGDVAAGGESRGARGIPRPSSRSSRRSSASTSRPTSASSA